MYLWDSAKQFTAGSDTQKKFTYVKEPGTEERILDDPIL
jgi:hypothetical protein